MRYHHEKRPIYNVIYGKTYYCDHPVYRRCTLYLIGDKGLAVIQQRYNATSKRTWWSEIDQWLVDELYLTDGFLDFFNKYAGLCTDGLYPTVTIRQIMWRLRLKPLKRERWETAFDHTPI